MSYLWRHFVASYGSSFLKILEKKYLQVDTIYKPLLYTKTSVYTTATKILHIIHIYKILSDRNDLYKMNTSLIH
jgi:hypothetical protein